MTLRACSAIHQLREIRERMERHFGDSKKMACGPLRSGTRKAWRRTIHMPRGNHIPHLPRQHRGGLPCFQSTDHLEQNSNESHNLAENHCSILHSSPDCSNVQSSLDCRNQPQPVLMACQGVEDKNHVLGTTYCRNAARITRIVGSETQIKSNNKARDLLITESGEGRLKGLGAGVTGTPMYTSRARTR